jgi:hypothetical protein
MKVINRRILPTIYSNGGHDGLLSWLFHMPPGTGNWDESNAKQQKAHRKRSLYLKISHVIYIVID